MNTVRHLKRENNTLQKDIARKEFLTGQGFNIFTGKVNHMILIDLMMSFILWMSAFVSLRHQEVNFQQTEARVHKIFSSVRQN